MSKITPLKFVESFEAFVKKQRSSIVKTNDTRKKLTLAIIGKNISQDSGSPLGDFITKKRFKDNVYRREDGSVDISIYKIRKSYRNILNMWFDFRRKPLDLKMPIYYDVLVELENVVERGYEEMAKLTYYNSNLKVLILVLWKADRLGTITRGRTRH